MSSSLGASTYTDGCQRRGDVYALMSSYLGYSQVTDVWHCAWTMMYMREMVVRRVVACILIRSCIDRRVIRSAVYTWPADVV